MNQSSIETVDRMWSSPGRRQWLALPLVLFVGNLYACYFVLRYGGHWTENDTAFFITATQHAIRAGTVLNSYYNHGFGYQALLGTVSLLTGASVSAINRFVFPFIGINLVFFSAFVTFRLLHRSVTKGAVSTLLLLLVPELMFSVLRGNHEKLSISFTLMMVYCFFQGVQASREKNLSKSFLWIVLYYVFVFLNAVTNDYFASTVVLANVTSVILLLFLFHRRQRGLDVDRVPLRNFGLSILTSWVVVLWVMFFLFPPAGKDFLLLQTAVQKVQNLFLNLSPAASNPYSAAHSAWAGSLSYLLSASFRWVLLIGSLGGLARILYRWWRRRIVQSESLYLSSIYLSFGLIVAISIPVDFVGLAAGTNLEVRNFTYFSIFAVPLFTEMLAILFAWRLPPLTRRAVGVGVSLALALYATVGVLKSTLDPVISNEWIFYTPSEKQALMAFLDRSTKQSIWLGPDNRLLYLFETLPQVHGNVGEGYRTSTWTSDILYSQTVRSSIEVYYKTGAPMFSSWNQVYDNGSVKILRRPATLLKY